MLLHVGRFLAARKQPRPQGLLLVQNGVILNEEKALGTRLARKLGQVLLSQISNFARPESEKRFQRGVRPLETAGYDGGRQCQGRVLEYLFLYIRF